MFFYCAFFPNGIPEHLKKDSESEKASEKGEDEEKLMGEGEKMEGKEEAKEGGEGNAENNGNGTNLM